MAQSLPSGPLSACVSNAPAPRMGRAWPGAGRTVRGASGVPETLQWSVSAASGRSPGERGEMGAAGLWIWEGIGGWLEWRKPNLRRVSRDRRTQMQLPSPRAGALRPRAESGPFGCDCAIRWSAAGSGNPMLSPNLKHGGRGRSRPSSRSMGIERTGSGFAGPGSAWRKRIFCCGCEGFNCDSPR